FTHTQPTKKRVNEENGLQESFLENSFYFFFTSFQIHNNHYTTTHLLYLLLHLLLTARSLSIDFFSGKSSLRWRSSRPNIPLEQTLFLTNLPEAKTRRLLQIMARMERHAYTLYTSLASRGHEVHVFTVSSDRTNHHKNQEEYYNKGDLHIYFAPNENGGLNISHAFEIFHRINGVDRPFDYVHTESVALPHWRVKMVPKGDVAVTWHGIWYEIMHSKLFEELYYSNDHHISDLDHTMPRLVDEIRFFPAYKQHICISNSAREVLVNIYQLPKRNVHVIVNGVDQTKFVYSPETGARFRAKHGVPVGNGTVIVMGVSGRLVRDKGHPLLYEAFALIAKTHPQVYLLPEELSGFYNALDVFVNPTLRPQGLDLTIIEAMQCGKPVVAPNYPSIVGTVVVDERFGYTFSPNVRSLVETLESVVRDGSMVLEMKGKDCKDYALSMFTATQMASAYERFFMCMTNERYCRYPLHIDITLNHFFCNKILDLMDYTISFSSFTQYTYLQADDLTLLALNAKLVIRAFANLESAAEFEESLENQLKDMVKRGKNLRVKLIEDIDEYDGEDPLFPWIKCVKWMQEAFPPGGECSGLLVIYEQCVRKNAKPVEKLNDAYKKFMVRTMRRTKTVDDEPKENDLPSRSFGTVLSRVDNNKTGRQALGPQANRTKLNHSSKAPLAVYKDTTTGDQTESDKSKPEFGSGLMLGGRAERNKENNVLPGKWAAFKVPQKPIVRTAASFFEVFVDEEECTDSEGVEKRKKIETISPSSSNVLPLNDGRDKERNRAAATEPFKTLPSQQLPTMIYENNHHRQQCSEI
ncbi:hypothetical protein HID58_072155, partial [Brassica napus]